MMERRKFLKVATGGAAASALAAPAIAQERTDMVIVSTWGRDFPGLGTSAQRLAARIEELTEGRIAVQYFAAGERVGAFDSFDEVASGNANAYIGADYYWKGKHPGWAPFTAVPFGLTYTEIDAWMKFGGGQELLDKLGAEFGIKGIPCGNTGVQKGGWFNKEINSPEDLKGLKMRIPGLGGILVHAPLFHLPILVDSAQPPSFLGAKRRFGHRQPQLAVGIPDIRIVGGDIVGAVREIVAHCLTPVVVQAVIPVTVSRPDEHQGVLPACCTQRMGRLCVS